ncbi:trypsin-like peptidase domain-containing protein [Lysobacter sp. K5869]|uniref:trypsin-like peptidase domain-containing protein n=1 Tax=Lysobacter sp. K5869 TaxID=2820808 RepID=UPI001C06390F|nr:trypsin-like peptidase domain-containing protein [Lysobacter sp. K5869]QWP74967.1 trypsin-like peptidase domain-containing protein [Lysobacter sp. K5869]
MQPKTIAEQLFFTTVRIDTVAANGAQGSGTGFFFNHKIGGNEYLFVATNKHVVMGMREGRFSFLKQKDGQPTLGDGFNLHMGQQDWPKMWFGHPDANIDIAVCPLAPLLEFVKKQHGTDLFLRAVNTSMIPTPQQVTELDAVESVTFIGYPNGVWDSKNLLPVARRGTTASPIEVDFEGTPRFLIDASVFGGSSGSPVFILNHGSWATKEGGLVAGTRFYFVGVIAAVFFRTHLNQIIPVPIPTQVQPMAQQQEMIDLGIVFKARTVVETIEACLKAHNVDTSAPAPIPAPQAAPDPAPQA